MARRRGDSGSTEWFGVTGTANTAETGFLTKLMGIVPGPTPTITGTPFAELPVGTLLRTFGTINAFNDGGVAGSGFQHPFAALHHDEALRDEAGNLEFQQLDLADSENLGFEGLFWLSSCIIWQAFSDGGNPDRGAAKMGCSMRVDSRSKRKLRTNDIIALDLSEVTANRELQFSYDLRFLIKYA